MANRDIVDGYTAIVTINFRTPLKFLEMYGKVYAEITHDLPLEHALWSVHFDEPEVGRQATQFGPLDRTTIQLLILPFLKKYRLIVESDLPPATKFNNLVALGEEDNFWRITIKNKSLGDYWAESEMTKIKGIGPMKARKLIAQGIYTPEQICAV